MKSDNTVCIYHGNCADGFGAAWVVRKFIEGDVVFYPGVHQSPPPDVSGRDVIIVDFSYKRETLLEMAQAARSLLVLDHHKTAAEDLSGLSTHSGSYKDFLTAAGFHGPHVSAQFDMARSGARLAWDCFFPESPPPMLIRVIEDRDLWRFAMPDTRALMTVIFSHQYDFATWDDLAQRLEDEAERAKMVSEGLAIDRKHFKDIGELISVTRRRAIIGGHDVPVANLPYTMSSDAGHMMAKGEAFAACYWDTPDGRVFSLRSDENGLDVSEIAKMYGGGGHKSAAGFRLPKLEMP